MTSAPDRDRLVEANAAFYERFEALDLTAMEALWSHGDGVYCVHPGGALITGWGPVRRSWAAIFATTSYLQFIVTDVAARAWGPGGAVTCTENILSGDSGGEVLGASRVVATNLYTWDRDRWLMVAHHASPVLRESG